MYTTNLPSATSSSNVALMEGNVYSSISLAVAGETYGSYVTDGSDGGGRQSAGSR